MHIGEFCRLVWIAGADATPEYGDLLTRPHEPANSVEEQVTTLQDPGRPDLNLDVASLALTPRGPER